MKIRPIRTDEEYRAALKEVSTLFDSEPEPGSEVGKALEAMVTLNEAYEAKNFPVGIADPAGGPDPFKQ